MKHYHKMLIKPNEILILWKLVLGLLSHQGYSNLLCLKYIGLTIAIYLSKRTDVNLVYYVLLCMFCFPVTQFEYRITFLIQNWNGKCLFYFRTADQLSNINVAFTKAVPGTPCNKFLGYCDVFHICREVSIDSKFREIHLESCLC